MNKRKNENSLHRQLMRRIMNEKMPPQSITPPPPQHCRLQSQVLHPLTMVFNNAQQTLYRKPRQMLPPPPPRQMLPPPPPPSPPPIQPRPNHVKVINHKRQPQVIEQNHASITSHSAQS